MADQVHPPDKNLKSLAEEAQLGAAPVDNRELGYEEFVDNAGSSPYARNLSRGDFNKLARSNTVNQYRADADLANKRFVVGDNKQAASTFYTEQEGVFNERVAAFQSDLEKLGQGDQQTAVDFKNITEFAIGLLSIDGDDEDSVAARQMAAMILRDNQNAIAPHLNEMDSAWWGTNYERINENLPRPDDSFWGRYKSNLGLVAQKVFGEGVGGHIVKTLASTEQSALNTVLGLSSAIDQNDGVSTGAGLKHAGSSAAGIVGSFLDQGLTGGRLGLSANDRYVTDQDGNVLSADYDGSGELNLREALGRTNELSQTGEDFAAGLGRLTGGRFGTGATERLVGLFDTVGIAAIDPLSWATMGQSGRANAALKTLERSADDVAVMAGVRLRNGLRSSQLDDVSQVAVRNAYEESQTQAIKAMTDKQVLRAGFRQSRGDVLQQLFKRNKDTKALRESLVSHRTDQLDDAVRLGSVPGLRIGGTTVVPMRRLYDALGRINSALADESAWAKKLLDTKELGSPQEIMAFVHAFEGGVKIPAEIKQQMRNWSGFARSLDDDPEVFLRQVLGESRDVDEAFEQLHEFGEDLFGKKTADKWRETYNSIDIDTATDAVKQGKLPGIDDAGPTGLIPGQTATGEFHSEDLYSIVAEAASDGTTITAAAKKLYGNKADLPLESARKLEQNLDVIDDPYKWIQKDFRTNGLRTKFPDDTLVGRFVARVTDKFSPRASLRRQDNFSRQTAQAADDVVAVASAKRDLFGDHVARLDMNGSGKSGLMQRVIKETGQTADEIDQEVGRILLDTNGGNLKQELLGAGPAWTQYVEVLDSIRKDIIDLSLKSGADEATMLRLRGYAPRVNTDAAQDLAQQAVKEKNLDAINIFERAGALQDGAIPSAKNPLTQQGAFRGNDYLPEYHDIFSANKAAEQELIDSGIIKSGDGFEMYDNNTMRSYLLRSKAAHEAYVYSDMLQGMSKTMDTSGRPLAYIANTADEKADMLFRKGADDANFGNADMVERSLPGGGSWLMDRHLVKEMDNARRIMGAPNTAGTVKGAMEQWNNIWGAYATVPLVGFGFHSRNATGNIFNMVLAGFKDPRLLSDAAGAQGAMRSIRKEMNATGSTWGEAAAKLDIEEGTRNVIDVARKYDIVGSGQTADLFGEVDVLKGGSTKNPFNQNNPVLRSGRALGTAIEDNARMALLMDGLNKGMDPQDASSRVRQYLFDYGDLTKFEADNIRMLSRFYTYMRKNTALQAKVLFTQPGRIANANRLMEEYVDTAFSALGFGEGEEVEGGLQEDGRKIPEWAADNMRLYGQGTLAGVDTPFSSFTDTLETLGTTLKLPATTIDFISGGTDGDSMRSELREAMQLLSGGPVEGVKTAFEFTSGVDTFTGAKLDDIDKTWLDTLFRLTDSVAPVGGKLDRELEYTGAYDQLDILQDEEGNDRSQGGLRLMNSILGMTTLSGIDDPDRIQANMRSLSFELHDALDAARDELPDGTVPKWDDLIDAGQASQRNEAMEYLLYSTVAGEPLTDEQRTHIERLVSKSVLEAYGYDVPDAERAEWDAETKANRVREQITAMQALGIEYTEDMEQSLILRESGIGVADAKSLGLEPSFQTNSWLAADKPEDYEEQRKAASRRQLEDLAAIFGTSVGELQASRPLLQPAERIAEQMREAGHTEGEIVAELTSKLARQERAMLFGEDSLETTRQYEALTPAELISYQNKIAAADAELRVLMQITFGRQPTAAEQREWLSEVLLTAPEQKALGLDNYVAPRAENVTTDEVYNERFNQKTTALADFGVELGLGN